ncbi:type II secretion system minor pseudopilin GspK [Pseudoduganella violacea]|uniref:Type II secretion system protein K n=1 Tax=Pseudoduganella violacea TaxID=1715466 RepID=A0A7W5BEX3_9BURK|nr:type II secretion system minor pseudopilin GspK [Pseudoduganella violacea]MBB3121874.1 general secretion pathway protein K [Pseudoduganella violacea]
MKIPHRSRQRGVAVVTALLLTTLAVTIVASLFWQQQVQVRSMENQRLHLQTRWILRGALDWARLILRQDGLDSQGKGTVTLNGVWATPLAETRLDQYVERERLQNESYDASLSGQIQDAQSRYNLINLADKVPGQKKPEELQMFTQLLVNLQMNPSLAPLIADYVAQSQSFTGTPNQPLSGSNNGEEPMPLTRVEDLLAVKGIDANTVEKLRDFVIVLPVQTSLNVNTAPAELLAALVPGASVAQAKTWAEYRKRTPFEDKVAFTTYMNGIMADKPIKAAHDVKSTYFLVQSRILLDRAALNAQTLIHRADGNNGWRASVVWTREY